MKTKSITKILTVFIAVIFLFVANSWLFSKKVYAQTDVKEITVFSWEDYIDEGYDDYLDASEVLRARYTEEELLTSVLDIFEEQTGIKVNYHSFATNEEMYNELLKDPTAVDLICPSEYMIMKMMDEKLIKPYTMPANYVNYGSTYIKGVFEELGMNTNDNKTYAIGYMWGTMGLIYDADKFSDEDFKSWTNLFDEKFSGKLTIKDSLRDSYIMAMAIVYKDELLELKSNKENNVISEEEYKSKLFEIFNRTDDQTIDMVGDVLIDLKEHLYGFEVDAGKNDLLTGKIDVNFAWSGDAVYSMDEGDKVGKNLRYVVPEEGSNVWFDGWVMTKDADEQSALEFLNFVCDPKIAVRNMDYVGYTSCIAGDEVFSFVVDNFGDDQGEKSIDLGYFFGNTGNYNVKVSDGEDGYYRHLYAQYADNDTIMRCAVMDNFNNEQLEKINEMWNKVKLITLPVYAIILIVLGILLIIGGLLVLKYRDRLFDKTSVKTNTKIKYKGCKVVEKVEIR